MRYVRSFVSGVVGLFVTDWTQTVSILVILAAGLVATRYLNVDTGVIGYTIAAILGLQLIVSAVLETRRRAAANPSGVAAPSSEETSRPA